MVTYRKEPVLTAYGECSAGRVIAAGPEPEMARKYSCEVHDRVSRACHAVNETYRFPSCGTLRSAPAPLPATTCSLGSPAKSERPWQDQALLHSPARRV